MPFGVSVSNVVAVVFLTAAAAAVAAAVAAAAPATTLVVVAVVGVCRLGSLLPTTAPKCSGSADFIFCKLARNLQPPANGASPLRE